MLTRWKLVHVGQYGALGNLSAVFY